MPVTTAAARFVAQWTAGTGLRFAPAGSPMDARIGRLCRSLAAVSLYAQREHLGLLAALTTPRLERAYAVMRPPVDAESYLRITHLWRWAVEHDDWDAASDPFLLLSPTLDYRWASQTAATLLGYADPAQLLARGSVGAATPPDERRILRVALQGRTAPAEGWGVYNPRTGTELALNTVPLDTDDGRRVGVLVRWRAVAEPVLPRLPVRFDVPRARRRPDTPPRLTYAVA